MDLELEGLNSSQRLALESRLGRNPSVDGILGPAGTGKTQVASYEACIAAYESGERVLIAAQQNAAVDQIILKTVDIARVAGISKERISRDIKRTGNLSNVNPLLSDCCTKNPNELSHAVIVGTTLYSAFVPTGQKILEQGSFDRVIIDESGQITPEQAWQVLRLIRNSDGATISAYGDDIQLTPIGYDFVPERSILRRMRESNQQLMLLDTTYRLNSPGVDMTSQIFYQGLLQAPQQVKDRKLLLEKKPAGLLQPASDPLNTLVYVPVEGEETRLGWSFDNYNQARVVADLCYEFIRLGISPSRISVIAAYSPHIRTINILLDGTGVQCRTVHKMLGGENDIIIFATTRSNSTKDLGFLMQPEILNVATSRQLRKLIIVGDAGETFSEGSRTSGRIFDFIAAHGSSIEPIRTAKL